MIIANQQKLSSMIGKIRIGKVEIPTGLYKHMNSPQYRNWVSSLRGRESYDFHWHTMPTLSQMTSGVIRTGYPNKYLSANRADYNKRIRASRGIAKAGVRRK